MHVAVDGRALRPGTARARGVARYLRCLLDELHRGFPDDRFSVVDPGRVRLALSALTGRPRLDRLVAGGCDVVWLPAPAPAAVSRDIPLVLTVHDLSFDHHATDYSHYERLWLQLAHPARLAERADRVLCVSETTRRAVTKEWGIDETKTRTILSGPGRPPVEERTRTDEADPRGVRDPFVLVVGALEPRKLPLVIAEAHRLATERGLRAELVFAGDGPLRGALESAGARVLGHVPDAVLDALYAEALAVVCASRDEGFGFTPLEALAEGTPAIVADLPVFHETLGDGALRVPPGDPAALADALLRLEGEPGLRDRLAAAGREALARLSWEKAARETRAALAEAAALGPAAAR
jgi:glycosyltransferase involved in cell wall biosynthesis